MLCAVPPDTFKGHMLPGAPLLVPWKGANTGARAGGDACAMCSSLVSDVTPCASEEEGSVCASVIVRYV